MVNSLLLTNKCINDSLATHSLLHSIYAGVIHLILCIDLQEVAYIATQGPLQNTV